MTTQRINPEQTNPSLIRRIQGGANNEAWNEFDALYRPMLLRFAKIQGLSDADMEDVVQHCMTAIYVHIDRFTYDPKRGRFKSWLRTMVNNRCRDLFRAKRDSTVEENRLNSVPAANDSPEDAFEKIWVDEHLNHCLRKIRGEVDEAAFAAFQRYVLDGQDVDQVCGDLGIAPKQLYKIKHRVTKKLRGLMAMLVGDEPDLSSRV